MKNAKSKTQLLAAHLNELGNVTVAVSGGVDSMTLAFLAHQVLGEQAKIVHSVSNAVPSQDTARVREYAEKYGWNMSFVTAGETDSVAYRDNPVNRCYYCKSCLYSTLSALNHGVVVSGTNLDDLSDYRPGLIAAKEHKVRHPFVEVGIDKHTLREIAHDLGLPALATLPASPCLSSRIETGIHILDQHLHLIDDVELSLKSKLDADNLRCRIQGSQVCIELDESTFQSLSPDAIRQFTNDVEAIVHRHKMTIPIAFRPYQRGSAFIGAK
ncbi:asparagine synthase-related protein [Enterovibrio sp. 27052020O]|uniref:asparagine synthase-related protein n=1 Tax=Enterovibrio sp. 27052020O TaxID=3241166 RepID=UPI003890BA28